MKRYQVQEVSYVYWIQFYKAKKFLVFQRIFYRTKIFKMENLTLPVPFISESSIEIKIKLHFYFYNSL